MYFVPGTGVFPQPTEGRLEVLPHFIVVAVDMLVKVILRDPPPLWLAIVKIPLVTQCDHALVATPGDGIRGSGSTE